MRSWRRNRRGYSFYRGIGVRSMTVASLAPGQLDARHWEVRVGWSAAYDTGEWAVTVEVEVHYFVQVTPAGPKIFAYIKGDEMGELRRLGLIGQACQGDRPRTPS